LFQSYSVVTFLSSQSNYHVHPPSLDEWCDKKLNGKYAEAYENKHTNTCTTSQHKCNVQEHLGIIAVAGKIANLNSSSRIPKSGWCTIIS
jgi:hypothetical protein